MNAKLSLLITAASTLLATSAFGYGLKVDAAGHAVRWAEMPVPYTISGDGSRDMERSVAVRAVRSAFAAWERHEEVSISFAYQGEQKDLVAGYDRNGGPNTNAVVWSGDQWGFDNEALAMTMTLFRTSTGVLVDADIIINERDYKWGAGDVENDLQNALAHEVGHFLGLDHSDVPEATMFASAGAHETHKRDLHEDDINGAARLYPNPNAVDKKANLGAFRDDSLPAAPTAEEAEPFEAPKVGCAAAVPGSQNSTAFGLFALLGIAAAARRRRRN